MGPEASPPEIALAQLDDMADLVPLMVEFNRAEGIAWRPEPMTAALERLLGSSDLGLVIVAREPTSRAAVGYGLATFGYDLEFAGRDAFVTELFVAPNFRGRGLGLALLAALLERLRERDARAVHLMVRPENARARALYERLGFAVSPRLMMTRELDPA